MDSEDKLGELSPLTCPECHGSMWEIRDGNLLRYRCHNGHALTAEAMVAAQLEVIEDTIYNALRAHKERAELLRRLAGQPGVDPATARTFTQRAEGYEDDAGTLREILLRQRGPTEAEA